MRLLRGEKIGKRYYLLDESVKYKKEGIPGGEEWREGEKVGDV